MKKTIKKYTVINILLFLLLCNLNAFSQTKYVPSGSVVIDMGVVPQTIPNGLKPYGLLYSLIKDFNTPIIWSIDPNKVKDGADFTVDGRTFKGGTFIISEEFLSSAVSAEIATWVAKGVVTYSTQNPVTVPLYKEIKFFANWVIDTSAGKESIPIEYLTNAEIPATSYELKIPSTLDACDDLFILPHADPTWAEHGNLYLWNQSLANGGNAGYIWSACHAVSALESMYNPADPTQQTNFLSQKIAVTNTANAPYDENALVLWTNHLDPLTFDFEYAFPTDAFMQFMGETNDAHASGSEQIYIPVEGGNWLPSTKVTAWSSTFDLNYTNQAGNAALSPGEAVMIAYGPARGDVDSGFVLYEGGHDHNNGTEAQNVAAQRVFLNFSFDAPSGKVPTIVENAPPATLNLENGASASFNITGTSTTGGAVTYEWLDTNAVGSFDDATSATPTFTVNPTPVVSEFERFSLTAKVIDPCGRVALLSYGFKLIPPPEPPIANNDNYILETDTSTTVTFNALINDTDVNFNIDAPSFTPTSSLSVAGGTFVNNGSGNLTFNASPDFAGTAVLTYQIFDDTPAGNGGPFSDTATITITISNDACGVGFVEGTGTAAGIYYAAEAVQCIINDKGQGNTPAACAEGLGVPDNVFTGEFRKATDIGEFRMEGNSDAGATVTVNFGTFEAGAELDLEISADGVTYTLIKRIIDSDIDGNEDYTFTAPIDFSYVKLYNFDASGPRAALDGIVSNYNNEITVCLVDTDNDGAPDTTDLDDDNDGILDTDECTAYSFNDSFEVPSIDALGPSTGLDVSRPDNDGDGEAEMYLSQNSIEGWSVTNGETFDIAYDIYNSSKGLQSIDLYGTPNATGIQKTFSGFTAGKAVAFSLDFSSVAPAFEATVSVDYGAGAILLTTLTPNNTATTDSPGVAGARVSSIIWSKYAASLLPAAAGTVKIIIESTGFGSGQTGILIDNVTLSQANCPDTDSDGIPDQLDSDSDNDGCPDALEAAGIFTGNQVTNPLPGGSVGGSLLNFGNTVNANGIPTTVTGGTISGTETTGQALTAAVKDSNDNDACIADLSIIKSVDKAVPKKGDTIVFTLIFKNEGPVIATGVQIKDVLPAGLTYNAGASTIPANTTYTASTGIWDLSNILIAKDQTIELKIAATVTSTGVIITNKTEIFFSHQTDTDSIPNNNN